jgi:hypothetical protein
VRGSWNSELANGWGFMGGFLLVGDGFSGGELRSWNDSSTRGGQNEESTVFETHLASVVSLLARIEIVDCCLPFQFQYVFGELSFLGEMATSFNI